MYMYYASTINDIYAKNSNVLKIKKSQMDLLNKIKKFDRMKGEDK